MAPSRPGQSGPGHRAPKPRGLHLQTKKALARAASGDVVRSGRLTVTWGWRWEVWKVREVEGGSEMFCLN